jgi:hypothetical protein
MRLALISAAVAALALAVSGAPGKTLAGDYGWYGDGYDGGWYTDVRRDGNVFYNAYNSYDGYYRHSYGGYWDRPYDGYDGGCCAGGGYGYGYGYGYGGDYDADDGYVGYRGGYGGRVYYPNYGYVDVTGRARHREERRLRCEASGRRLYRGRCF